MGPSKKVAKRNAAEKMLELLGFKVPQPQPPKPALKTEEKVHSNICVFICVRFLPTSNKELSKPRNGANITDKTLMFWTERGFSHLLPTGYF